MIGRKGLGFTLWPLPFRARSAYIDPAGFARLW